MVVYYGTEYPVFTRVAVEQIFQESVRKIDVINVFRRINNKFGIKGVTIRNDNGSQFIANDVKQFLRAAEANQEFTHVATPEENSYIEAFHSIVQREIVDRYEFISIYDAKSTVAAHMDWYNNRRRHSIIKMTPAKKWKEYFGREFGFNSVQINNKIDYQQVDGNIEIKPYFCLPDKTFEEENYKTILSFKSN